MLVCFLITTEYYFIVTCSSFSQTGEVQNTNEIDLKLYISGDQLKTLRQFAKEEESKSIPLRKLDEIFTAVFVKPYINLPSLGSISNMFSNFKACICN